MFPANGTAVLNNADDVFKQRYPFHVACRDGDLNALSLLLLQRQQQQQQQQQGGGNLDQSDVERAISSEDDQYGWTPAHWAAYFGKMECLQKLVQTNQQTTVLDRPTTRFSQTPAHMAAFGRHHGCLQWLLQSGSQRDKQDCMGETPLHKAARTGSLECLSVLTAHGANVQIMNNSGVTASRLASLCGNTAASQYLKQMETQVGWFNGTHPHENGISNVMHPNPAFINEGLNGGHLPNIFGVNGIPTQNNRITALNGFHSLSTNGYSHIHCNGTNGISNGHVISQTNGHPPSDMEMDNASMDQQNGHISNGCSPAFTNGYVPVTVGRKRSSDAFLHADDVKRMKTFEDRKKSDEAISNSEFTPNVEQEPPQLQPPAAPPPRRPRQLRYWLYVV